MTVLFQILVAVAVLATALPHANRATRSVPTLLRAAFWAVGFSAGFWLIELLARGAAHYGPWMSGCSLVLMIAVDRRHLRRQIDDLVGRGRMR